MFSAAFSHPVNLLPLSVHYNISNMAMFGVP